MTGRLVEVFYSIQGEGLYVGRPQIFIRLAGCNLQCRYCDTPAARGPAPAVWRIEREPGARAFEERPNPASASELADALAAWPARDAATFTGGEPLLQPDFLAAATELLRSQGRSIHLETNGVLVEELRRVIDIVDVVAMDIKLSSATGEPNRFEANRAFLETAAAREAFVKLVVAARTPETEAAAAARLVADVDPSIPVVIQPVSAPGERPDERHLLALAGAAAAHVRFARVIPQVHKLAGWL